MGSRPTASTNHKATFLQWDAGSIPVDRSTLGLAQLVSASGWGPEDREFESRTLDQSLMNDISTVVANLSTLTEDELNKLRLHLYLTCFRHECNIRGRNVAIYAEEKLKPDDMVEMVKIDANSIFARKLKSVETVDSSVLPVTQ